MSKMQCRDRIHGIQQLNTARRYWHAGVCGLAIASSAIASTAFAQVDDFLTLCGGGIGGLPSAWTRGQGNISYTEGSVGIGTANPAHLLDVRGVGAFESLLINNKPPEDYLESFFINEGQVNSISSTMLRSGIVGAREIDSAAVQKRVANLCNPGSSIREIKETGGITCEPDDVGISSIVPGDGISVTNGNEVAVNYTTLDNRFIRQGQVNSVTSSMLSSNSVTSDKIADGGVGQNDVRSNEVQIRKSNADMDCSVPGGTVDSVRADGTVGCEVRGAVSNSTYYDGSLVNGSYFQKQWGVVAPNRPSEWPVGENYRFFPDDGVYVLHFYGYLDGKSSYQPHIWTRVGSGAWRQSQLNVAHEQAALGLVPFHLTVIETSPGGGIPIEAQYSPAVYPTGFVGYRVGDLYN